MRWFQQKVQPLVLYPRSFLVWNSKMPHGKAGEKSPECLNHRFLFSQSSRRCCYYYIEMFEHECVCAFLGALS